MAIASDLLLSGLHAGNIGYGGAMPPERRESPCLTAATYDAKCSVEYFLYLTATTQWCLDHDLSCLTAETRRRNGFLFAGDAKAVSS